MANEILFESAVPFYKFCEDCGQPIREETQRTGKYSRITGKEIIQYNLVCPKQHFLYYYRAEEK